MATGTLPRLLARIRTETWQMPFRLESKAVAHIQVSWNITSQCIGCIHQSNEKPLNRPAGSAGSFNTAASSVFKNKSVPLTYRLQRNTRSKDRLLLFVHALETQRQGKAYSRAHLRFPIRVLIRAVRCLKLQLLSHLP